MIQNFDIQTAPLNTYEQEILLPIMVKCLKRRKGKAMAITNTEMCTKMKAFGYAIGDVRVRKLINYIRLHGLVNSLIASSSGYYVAENPKEVREYIQSLMGREAAIKAVREALETQVDEDNLGWEQ